jgi:hypothetical protein
MATSCRVLDHLLVEDSSSRPQRINEQACFLFLLQAANCARIVQGKGTLVVSGGTSGVGGMFVAECVKHGIKR